MTEKIDKQKDLNYRKKEEGNTQMHLHQMCSQLQNLTGHFILYICAASVAMSEKFIILRVYQYSQCLC